MSTPAVGTPTVLFLCVHNAGRSQMALGWFNHLAGGRAIAYSGGSEPAEAVNPAAVAAMREVGIDIGDEHPKRWTESNLRAADVVVTMGCGDTSPTFPASATRIGNSTTPRASASVPSAPSATTSNDASRDLLAELGVPVA